MKHGMTIEYLKCRADFNFEVDFGVTRHWYDCDKVGSYCIRIIDHFDQYNIYISV